MSPWRYAASESWTSAALPTLPGQRQLLVAFWIGAIGILGYALYNANTESLWLNFGAVLVIAIALVPSYLWSSGRIQGIPIFPLFAATHIWTYGLPLVTENPGVEAYSVSSRLFAALTTAGFLALSTLIWFQFVQALPSQPPFYRALAGRKGDQFFLACSAISVLFNIANAGGWLGFLEGASFSLVRNTVVALTALSAFVLAYRFGKQELSSQQSKLFIGLLVAFMVSGSVSFLLVGAASVFISAVVAFIIGRRQIPIITIIVVAICLNFLHLGKSGMRAKYWFNPDQPPYIQPWEYPVIYAEWIESSSQYIAASRHASTTASSSNLERRQSFLERSSVIQMLMLAQTNSPVPYPYVNGKTYAILPELLIPRFLSSSKIVSHAGTHMLNIHYGRQRLEDTYTTTIGWGLLAESYANFGLLGCMGLAIVLGSFYGKITSLSLNTPILSLRSLFAVLIFTCAFQSEWTAGVYVAALGQYTIVLGGIAIVLMTNHRVPSSFSRVN
jgi:hypothetical protein